MAPSKEDPFGLKHLIDGEGIPSQEAEAMSAEVQQSPISSVLSYFAAMGGSFESLQEFETALLSGGLDETSGGRKIGVWNDVLSKASLGVLLLVPLGVRGFAAYESVANVFDYAPRLTVASCASGELTCYEHRSLDEVELVSATLAKDGRRHVIRPKIKLVDGRSGAFEVIYQIFAENME